MRNIEFKAKTDDLHKLEEKVSQLGSEEPQDLWQKDTFFTCSTGRLKLREFADGTGELIQYMRSDGLDPRPSSYLLAPVTDAKALGAVLEASLGTIVVVEKHRRVYLLGRSRIHLDQIVKLGSFIEVEVVLVPDEDDKAGMDEAFSLLRRLDIRKDQLVGRAYADLILEASQQRG